MKVRRLTVGPLETNCWLVADDEGAPVLVIDPAGEAERIIQEVDGREVVGVVLTHGHFDHLGAAGELVEATGAPLLVHAADAPQVSSSVANGARFFGFDMEAPEPDGTLEEGASLAVGSVELEVLHTPGHTPGGISLLGEGHLFSGDLVFAGSVGRTDFPGGDAGALERSIAEKVAPLPDETVIHPGHGPDTTVGRERRVNPFFPRA